MMMESVKKQSNRQTDCEEARLNFVLGLYTDWEFRESYLSRVQRPGVLERHGRASCDVRSGAVQAFLMEDCSSDNRSCN